MKKIIPKFVLQRKCGMRVLPDNENFITVNITGEDRHAFMPFHIWSKLTHRRLKMIVADIISSCGIVLDEVKSVTLIYNGYQTEYSVEVPNEI